MGKDRACIRPLVRRRFPGGVDGTKHKLLRASFLIHRLQAERELTGNGFCSANDTVPLTSPHLLILLKQFLSGNQTLKTIWPYEDHSHSAITT